MCAFLYLTRIRRNGRLNRKTIPIVPIDISRNAQLRDIETSFVASNDDFDLSALKHPNKPDVTAVESYPILPDAQIWPNQYDLFRFSERPGDRPVDVCFIYFYYLSDCQLNKRTRSKTSVWIVRFCDL